MKKFILVSCLLIMLSGCSDNTSMEEETTINRGVEQLPDTVNYTQVDANYEYPFFETKKTEPKVSNSLTDQEMQSLSSKKCGYGQGLRLDDKNRPFCALDFNNEFSKYDSFAIKENCGKEIYITFDEGYENGFTPQILDTLKEKGVKATFFVVDDYARRNPELVKRMVDEGHIIGNHSVHHYSMPTLDINTSRQEINQLHDYILEKFDYDMTLFRPPMGEFSEQSLAVTQSCGHKTVLWSFAYCDWDPSKQMEPSKALEKLTSNAHDGGVFLLHAVSSTNAEILGDFIDNLKQMGYEFPVLS